MKWQIGSRRRSGRRRTGYVERARRRRAPRTERVSWNVTQRTVLVRQVFHGREDNLEQARGRAETPNEKREEKRRDEDERVERSHARRVHDVVFATKPRRSAGVTFILTRSSSLFSLLLLFSPLFLSFFLSFFLLPSPIRKNHSILATQRGE